jgi:hypothetical protein
VTSEEKNDCQLAEKIYKALKGNHYFRNSVIIAMGDGQLVVCPTEPLRKELLKALGAGVPKEFTAQQLEFQEGVFHCGCRPVVKSAKRYTREFPSYLSDRICETLVACS